VNGNTGSFFYSAFFSKFGIANGLFSPGILNPMIFTIFNLLKGRFSKVVINEDKTNKKAMSRQEALQQMRNIASRRSGKKN